MKNIHKQPRLYCNQDLSAETPVSLSSGQAHYLKSVMRLGETATIRLFNGRHGEWVGSLSALNKKAGTVILEKQLKEQPVSPPVLHLLFAPIKKNRMDFLIEKAVELGVTDLHPVITAHTEVRKLKTERIETQIIEAAEQCERLTLPHLHKPESLDQKLKNWTKNTQIFWAAERLETSTNLANTNKHNAFLIGPEGGFDDSEIKTLTSCAFIKPISLGEEILRAETASLYCLSHARLCMKD